MLDPRLKTRRILHVLAACLLVSASPSIAMAAPKSAEAAPASSGGAIEDPCLSDRPCNDLYESAQALSKNGQYAAAVSNYESAYRMHPMPWLLVNIGRVHQKSGNPQAAIDSYQRYFAMPESDREAATNAKAREYLRQAEEDLKRPKKLTVIHEREVSGPRPLWRILTGTGMVALGVAGIGLGAAGLNLNGRCVEDTGAIECRTVYTTLPMGIGFTVAGVVVAGAGAVLIALPGPRNSAVDAGKKTEGSTESGKPADTAPRASLMLGGVGSGLGAGLVTRY